jgi:hypothetical protein
MKDTFGRDVFFFFFFNFFTQHKPTYITSWHHGSLFHRKSKNTHTLGGGARLGQLAFTNYRTNTKKHISPALA